MKIFRSLILFGVLLFFSSIAYCQEDYVRQMPIRWCLQHSDSSTVWNESYVFRCHQPSFFSYYLSENSSVEFRKRPVSRNMTIHDSNPKPKVLIHGSVYYDFIYRSNIDTPFSQKNLQQHTERIQLLITSRSGIPLKLGFALRQSNSPFFRNYFDPNLSFDKNEYLNHLKIELTQILENKFKKLDYAQFERKLDSLRQLESQLYLTERKIHTSNSLQNLIEQKEKSVKTNKFEALKQNDSINWVDSTLVETVLRSRSKILILTTKSKRRIDSTSHFVQNNIDSLKLRVVKLQNEIDSLRKLGNDQITAWKEKLYKAKSLVELNRISKELNIDSGKNSNISKVFSGIQRLDIGKVFLDYSELTVQNVMISGLNIEYNDRFYLAAAAGKVDYRFRDFFQGSKEKNRQYLTLGRIGFDNQEKIRCILTLYNGKKNNLEYGIADTVNAEIPVTGYSVQITKRLKSSFITAEIAKSSRPSIGRVVSKSGSGLFDFKDNSNVAWTIKAEKEWAQFDTKAAGFYRKSGARFQSFSLFNYNTDQSAWQIKLDKRFFKGRVASFAMVRKNDFSNPFANQTYKSSTIFGSFYVVANFKKFPIVSIGYFPGTQLYLVDGSSLRENVFYILNSSLLHTVTGRQKQWTTSINYNKYLNKATDSFFIRYRGINLSVREQLKLTKMESFIGWTFTNQPELKYATYEAGMEFQVAQFLSASGTYSHSVSSGKSFSGGSISLELKVKRLGVLFLRYEKTFIPSLSQDLSAIETGRLTWIQNF